MVKKINKISHNLNLKHPTFTLHEMELLKKKSLVMHTGIARSGQQTPCE